MYNPTFEEVVSKLQSLAVLGLCSCVTFEIDDGPDGYDLVKRLTKDCREFSGFVGRYNSIRNEIEMVESDYLGAGFYVAMARL